MHFAQYDVIHILSWDDGLPNMIVPDVGYEIVGVISKFSITTPFSLIPDRAPLQLIPSTPSYTGHHHILGIGTRLSYLFYGMRILMYRL